MNAEIAFRRELLSKKEFVDLFADDPVFMLQQLDKIMKMMNIALVLDLGAGPCVFGYYSSLKRKCFNVISLDISSDALKSSQLIFGYRGTRICGDAIKLPFKDEVFDVIFCSAFLHHLEDMNPILSECKRILKSGGRMIAINEPCSPSFVLSEMVYSRLFGRAEKKKGVIEKPRTYSEYVREFYEVFGNVKSGIDLLKTERNIQSHNFLWRCCYKFLKKSYFTVGPFAVILTATRHI